VNGNTADFAGLKINPANVDATTQRDAERRDCISDRRCAPNRACGSGEDANKPIAAVSDLPATEAPNLISCRLGVPIEYNAPFAIPELSHSSRRVDNIGYKDSDEYPVVFCVRG
jgi:hypothetical protein